MVAAGEERLFELQQAGSDSAYLVKEVYLAMVQASLSAKARHEA
jgi:hypothetical protein